MTTEQCIDILSLPESPNSLYEPIRYTMKLGGKRIRPKMLINACGLCNGDTSRATRAAVAIEALHNFTLIHDDIMDNARTRRGQQTVHTKWDENIAILSGDALFARSVELIGEYAIESWISFESFRSILAEFLKATRTVCEGQALDMEFERSQLVSLESYLDMIYKKTAALLESSMKIGAMLAGATDLQINDIGNIGRSVGLAFQIQDDLLDVIGNPDKFGKAPGGDILMKKKTYLSITALQMANEIDRNTIMMIYSKPEIDSVDVLKITQIYHESGAIERAKKEIRTLYKSAEERLAKFPESIHKNEINSLLDQLTIREN